MAWQSDVDETPLKLRFAAEVLAEPSLNGPHIVAQRLFPGEQTKATQVCQLWPNDPVVIAECERLLAERGPRSFLPSKEATAQQAWNIGAEMAKTVPEKIAAFRFYAELMAYIERPGTVVNNNNSQYNSGVLIVREETPEEWERETAAQQRRLEAECARSTAVTVDYDG